MPIHARTCHLCEAMCGLSLEVQDDRIVSVRGDDDDVLSHGHLCPKGAAIGELHHDPDRLVRPLLRSGSTWSEIGWDEALDRAAEGLRKARAHGPRAVGLYLGNPTVHNTGATLGVQLMARSLRTISRYSASTVDQMPRHLASWLLYGHQFLVPVPDLQRTDLLVILGANPVASNGSLLSAPGIRGLLRDIAHRGRVVLLDPRRTETAKVATEHWFLRPATDAWVLAALARLLARAPAPTHLPVRNLDRLRALLEPFTPELAEARSGVGATALVELAGALRDTPRASVYGRIGTCTQAWGSLNSWLIDVVNLLAGNLDVEGGAMLPEPAIDMVASDVLATGGSRARWHSRVRGLPEVMGELPVATLAEDIAEPGDDRIRALITVAGNPALSTPGAERLQTALASLDFMVSIDPYLNETTRHAHLILPPASTLTQPHYDIAFHHFAMRNTTRLSLPVVPQPPGTRSDWQILTGLALRLGRGRVSWQRNLTTRALRLIGEHRVLDLMLRTGPYGRGSVHGLTLARVRAHVHGLDLGPLRPNLGRRMHSKALDLAPDLMVEELRRLADAGEAPPLVLIGRRHLRSNNSWMHNQPSLVKGRDRCTLLVHPQDAVSLGLEDGGSARIVSAVGQVEAPVQVTDEIMPGVVSLPHGWGHAQDTGLSVAKAHPGVNVNVLTDPSQVDGPTGNAVLGGVPVRISPVSHDPRGGG